ncbi:MAG: hypothetical protein GQ565_11440 [Candidatus Aegiribacteria sp.]|nr:hypothetical protein [Candidatus Aegiribacteria sp.]
MASARKNMQIYSTILVLTIPISILVVPRIVETAQSKLTEVYSFIDVNKSFAAMIEYVSCELPPESIVLVISAEQSGKSAESWRHQGLAFRATEVRVMNVKSIQSMVLGLGGDASVSEFRPPDDDLIGCVTYGVVYSPAELEVFQDAWNVIEVVDFSRGVSSCKIIELQPKHEESDS